MTESVASDTEEQPLKIAAQLARRIIDDIRAQGWPVGRDLSGAGSAFAESPARTAKSAAAKSDVAAADFFRNERRVSTGVIMNAV